MNTTLKQEKTAYGNALVSLIFTGSMVCTAKAKNIPLIFNTKGGKKQ